MDAAVGAENREEKQLPSQRGTVSCKPRKECLQKNCKSEESATSDNESHGSDSPGAWSNTQSALEEWEEDVSSTPEAVPAPQPDTAPVHEVEDWDRELEEAACSPYDADDFNCGSFEGDNLLAPYVCQEDWFYDPGCHHAPCFAFPRRARRVEMGQFDDADE
ncbi:PREDICTED: coordinator of PRMT5 and differentiation stimulator [Acanthisitta chloris]|uniref:coordinator of PRMT5 and differentiation stimulator n=1 Tax=Acanthisitta chloris TaxID=57068 RepID=UPI0004F0CD13|nr:PREDICTED: coordinator of PRMT5 and differentiation stimulator [Acanthisitta chloris]